MPKRIQETAATLQALATASPGRFKVRVISSGTGSSGHYPAATIKDAVERGVWHKGQHVYMDHPGAAESDDRPERTLRDLVGVIDEDATYDDVAEAADAVVKVYSPYRPLLEEMKDDIGLSIRAWAEHVPGEVNGEPMPIITRLTEGLSVDFVTHAGRGGRVLEVLESATRVASNAPLSEATTSDRREQLQKAIRDTYPNDDPYYGWIRDFDPDRNIVWFERDEKTWQQTYTVADDDMSVSLTGERIEVRPVTQYHPVTSAGEVGESSPQPKETAMEITEAKFAELTAAAERATALEGERDSAVQRAEAAEADARTRAREAYDAQVGAALAASDLSTEAREAIADKLKLADEAEVPASPETHIAEAIKAQLDFVAKFAQPAQRGMGFGGAATPAIESYTNPWGRTITTKEA